MSIENTGMTADKRDMSKEGTTGTGTHPMGFTPAGAAVSAPSPGSAETADPHPAGVFGSEEGVASVTIQESNASTSASASERIKEMYSLLGLTDSDFIHELVLGSQDSAAINAVSAQMRVRGGGIGANAWMAKVVGPDPKWGIERQFLETDASLSGSGRSGSIRWHIDGDGIYEYRGWAASSRYTTSGFIAVKDGMVADLGNRKAGVKKAAVFLGDGVWV
ncbi:hypothetical protein ABIB15_002524 [Marisediminicola sp. UYEF4]|uniref:hypothetical protein n=1 Tax=Marisediminicola sp. UYEF4 TaxID=1756384 RepID=UPI003396B46A